MLDPRYSNTVRYFLPLNSRPKIAHSIRIASVPLIPADKLSAEIQSLLRESIEDYEQLAIITPKTRLVFNSALTIALFLQSGVRVGAATTACLERKRRSRLNTDRAVAGTLGTVAFIAKR